MSLLKSLFNRFFRKNNPKTAVSPFKLNLVDKGLPNGLSFTLTVGVDVEVKPNSPHNIDVHVNQLLFSSNGDKARTFIQTVDDSTLKMAISTLCSAAALHVLEDKSGQGFVRATLPSVSDLLGSLPPPDKNKLN